MGQPARQAQIHGGPGTHLVLFDGVCGLCDHLVQFTLKYDRRAVFDFAALQSATGRSITQSWGHNPEDLSTFFVVANYQTARPHPLTRSAAALFLLGELGWPWRAARLFQRLPHVLGDPLYDVIARNRYRIFGTREQCRLPEASIRKRFIDS